MAKVQPVSVVRGVLEDWRAEMAREGKIGSLGKARSRLKVAELFFSVEEEGKLSGRAAIVYKAVQVEGRKGINPLFLLRGVTVAE